MSLSLLLVLGLTVVPDPPQAGAPLQVQVPLGVDRNIDSAAVRVARRAGIPVAEVLLVRDAGGLWRGVIDGRLVQPPRLGLWVKVRARDGRYRNVLGSADQPVWVDVAGSTSTEQHAVTRTEEFIHLDNLRRANERPELGFRQLRPAPRLGTRLANEIGFRPTQGIDGRCRAISHGRVTDRFHALEIGLLGVTDPWDGSIPCDLYVPVNGRVSTEAGLVSMTRPRDERYIRLRGGLPSRLGLDAAGEVNGYRWNLQYLEDLAPSGLTVGADHSAGLPSRVEDRRLSDTARRLWLGLELPGPLVLGMFHETAGGYFGPYDSLVSGFDKRHRTALMMGLRQRRKWLLTQIQMSYWYQRDQRELAGPGLRLQDADGDGSAEVFPLGVQVDSKRHLLSHRWSVKSRSVGTSWRWSGRLRARGLTLLNGAWATNMGIDGRALSEPVSHPQFGHVGATLARPTSWGNAFHEGFLTGEALVHHRRGNWSLNGALGPVWTRRSQHPLSADLRVKRQLPGQRILIRMFAQPELRLLDRWFDPLGQLAANLSESMPYGHQLIRLHPTLHGEPLTPPSAPFHEGLEADLRLRESRAVGIWRYRLLGRLHRALHTTDGINRSGHEHPFVDDGDLVEASLRGTIDFAAWSGLRFHGSIWMGQSWAPLIEGDKYGEGVTDTLVPLFDYPTWRWVNSIDQRIFDAWSTGGSLQAWGPQRSSERHRLTALYTFQIPAQLKIGAWIRYHRGPWSLALRFDNAMSRNAVAPVPRPDRVPGLLPVDPRRVLLEVDWRPSGLPGDVVPFQSSF
ncbi:MAG: hypothetical protein CMH58_04970 [Myxococcales bacterium]|nr:hypothetical protein [Myxococcales bacterium]